MKITAEYLQQQRQAYNEQIPAYPAALDEAFGDAASVLVFFEPESLHSFGIDNAPSQIGWTNFFSYCDPVKHRSDGNWWQLKSYVRKQRLKKLATREMMLAALQANQERTQDVFQKLFDCILQNTPIDISNLKREEMVQLLTILEWLKDILPLSEMTEAVQKCIPLADLLAPMKRLARDNFVGRKNEIETLNKYIGIKSASTWEIAERFIRGVLFSDLKEHPPYFIYGPGGVGKSTLMARFILDNAGNIGSGSLPFIYLDIDRNVLDPEQPVTFVIEACSQLALQCSREQQIRLVDLKQEIELRNSRFDKRESSKSIGSADFIITELGAIIRSIDKPVLLVIDTFEEAQYLGEEVVNQIWKFMIDMQRAAPNLRIVVAGRALVNKTKFPINELPLAELSKPEAREFLLATLPDIPPVKGRSKKDIADKIIEIVGLNPLSLRLACMVISNEGIEKLRSLDISAKVASKIKSEIIQARLYGRILAHVHNEEVKKLAYPGLIVRRITPEVIMQVLAGPCGLKLENISEVERMIDEFSKEVALVEPDPIDGALYHRQDVRRIMLKDLQNVVNKETIGEIHKNAILYYSKKEDNISRGEEIYHLLASGNGLEEAKKRWRPGLEPQLRNALEELGTQEQLWLSEKLGVTPDKDLVKNADIENWEQVTAKAAQRYLQNGNAGSVLELVRSREERTLNSPLYRLELEALRYLGLYEEANYKAEEALFKIAGSASNAVMREVLMQAAFIKEALGNFDESLQCLERAEELLSEKPDALDQLRNIVSKMRILRKEGDIQNEERSKLMKQAEQLLSNSETLYSLRNSPALLRELVAELGKVFPFLLPYAIDWIGLELRDPDQVKIISNGLLNWNAALKLLSSNVIGELAERAGIKSNDLQSWITFIQNNGEKSLSSNILNWRTELSSSDSTKETITDFDKILVDIYRTNVDSSINKNLTAG